MSASNESDYPEGELICLDSKLFSRSDVEVIRSARYGMELRNSQMEVVSTSSSVGEDKLINIGYTAPGDYFIKIFSNNESFSNDVDYRITAQFGASCYQNPPPGQVASVASLYASTSTGSCDAPPLIPTNISATDGLYIDTVQISWDEPAGADTYLVYRCASLSTDSCNTYFNSSASPYNDLEAGSGVVYYYKIKSCNSFGCSDFSSTDSGSSDSPQSQTPVIASVNPEILPGLPLPQKQRITLYGSGFSDLTRLTFNDGTTDHTDRIPIVISDSELQYDIAVGPDAASWTVVAYNGSAASNLYPFSVTAGTAAPTVLLWANPIIVQPGDPVTLTWDTGNATTCQASGGTSEWDGPQELSNSTGLLTYPLGTTVYVLTCTGSGGSTTDVAAATVSQTGDYLLTMTTDRDPVVSGNNQSLLYTLTVSNQGSMALTGVVVRNDVPVGMDVQEHESGGAICAGGFNYGGCTDGEYLRWSLGDLAPGESKVVQFTARQNGALSPGFLIHNEMVVTDAGGGSASLAKDVAVVSGSDDTDGDGLTNSLENSIGTDILQWDTDGDGLSDYHEVAYDGDPNSYVAGQDLNPLSDDSDGDGYSDYEELITFGTDPLDSNSVPVLADGDVNADGVVDVADVLLAQKFVTGQLTPTQDQLDHGDVAPLVNGAPVPDGLFNVGDLLVIQRKALGLVNF